MGPAGEAVSGGGIGNPPVERDGLAGPARPFGDFARVGMPLTILIGAVVLALAPLVYGFSQP